MFDEKKYYPKTLGDIVFQDDIQQERITDIVDGITPFPLSGKNGILLFGIWGTGKTTLAKLLPNAIEQRKSRTNAYNTYFACQQGINGASIMEKLRKSAELCSFNHSGYHYFILDEVDNLTPAAMASLKSAMNIPSTIFILTTNHIDKIDTGVLNRCERIACNAADAKRWLPYARKVLGDLGVTDVTDDALIAAIDFCKGSCREITSAVVRIAAKRKKLQALVAA